MYIVKGVRTESAETMTVTCVAYEAEPDPGRGFLDSNFELKFPDLRVIQIQRPRDTRDVICLIQ